jgi:hypothetical protein
LNYLSVVTGDVTSIEIDGVLIDLVAVERVANGRPAVLTTVEQRYAARLMCERGMSAEAIAARLGVWGSTVTKWQAAGWVPGRGGQAARPVRYPGCSQASPAQRREPVRSLRRDPLSPRHHRGQFPGVRGMSAPFVPAHHCDHADLTLMWESCRWELRHQGERLLGTLDGFPVGAEPNGAREAIAWAADASEIPAGLWIQRPARSGAFHTHVDAGATCLGGAR